VSMTAPSNSTTVSGNVSVSANASDNVGVVGVQFMVDGQNQGAEDTSAPYQINWDTTKLTNKNYSLTAKARDAAGNRTTSTAVKVTVQNGLPTLVRLIRDPANLAMVIVMVRSYEIEFAGPGSVTVNINLPSVSGNLTLNQLKPSSPIFYTTVNSNALTAADINALNNLSLNVNIVAGRTIAATGEKGTIIPELGGRLIEENGDVEVVIPANSASGETKLTVVRQSISSAMSAALNRQDLINLGVIRDITLTPAVTLKADARIKLRFERSKIPNGLQEANARIGRYNPQTDSWEIVNNFTLNGNHLEANLASFSIYAPVMQGPNSGSNLREAFVYPNPAVSPEHPRIRAKVGKVERLEITIYDVAGDMVHSVTIDGGTPTGIDGGEYFYEYTWSGGKASGVYFAVIHGQNSGETIRAKTKFAVVR